MYRGQALRVLFYRRGGVFNWVSAAKTPPWRPLPTPISTVGAHVNQARPCAESTRRSAVFTDWCRTSRYGTGGDYGVDAGG